MESQDARARAESTGRVLNAVVAIVPPQPSVTGGPLNGLPVAVKDMFDVTGFARGNGNPEDMQGELATSDAVVVAQLRSAGADVVALASLLEYAAGAQHPGLPEARNPADVRKTAGGSSGGSAALVGSGVVPVALGTDTGGSIRLPAHYCGVVGFKPTHATLSTEGVTALSPTFDHVGLLAVDIATTALVFEALTGIAPEGVDRPLRIGVLVDQLGDVRLDPEVRDVVALALGRLSAVSATEGSGAEGFAGLALSDLDGSALDALNDTLGPILLHEAWAEHGSTVLDRPEHFGDATLRLLMNAGTVSRAEYDAALGERAVRIPKALALLDGVDLLLGPAAPYAAPEVSPPIDTPAGEIEGIYSGPYNVTGQPALVLPCGLTPGGLPVGLQLAAAPGADALLLAGAALVERLLVM